MIELGLVDLSADSRRRLASLVERWMWSRPEGRLSAPRISLQPLSPEEVRFNGAIDVCIVGPELIDCDAAFINSIRQQLPDKILICVLDARSYSFGLVEQLGRFGVDDVLVDSASSDEFFRRLLLLQRKIRGRKKGSLVVVDSARGGVGRTFITAALSEGWFLQGQKVCVIDCDVISQDLTRFLQVRPHVNDSLRMLIEQQRVVTSDTVSECVRPVWVDEPRFGCVAPPTGGDETLYTTQHAQRGLLAVVEALLLQYDRVVVDTSSLVSAAKNALFQSCDELFFVVNRDASAAYANRQALSLISGFMRPDASLTTIINDNGAGSAPPSLLKSQVVVIAGRSMSHLVVPRCAKAMAWMCSGYTPYRFLRRYLREAVCSTQAGEQEGGRWFGFVPDVLGKAVKTLRRVVGAVTSRWNKSKDREVALGSLGSPNHLEPPVLLSLGHELHDQHRALVSKPVLLG
jgi:MinD-like ATPase involved in chromosome partitioning or flagellar assembly